MPVILARTRLDVNMCVMLDLLFRMSTVSEHDLISVSVCVDHRYFSRCGDIKAEGKCNEDRYKDFWCPVTCGTCSKLFGHFGIFNYIYEFPGQSVARCYG